MTTNRPCNHIDQSPSGLKDKTGEGTFVNHHRVKELSTYNSRPRSFHMRGAWRIIASPAVWVISERASMASERAGS
jgi:hypothetical protein